MISYRTSERIHNIILYSDILLHLWDAAVNISINVLSGNSIEWHFTKMISFGELTKQNHSQLPKSALINAFNIKLFSHIFLQPVHKKASAKQINVQIICARRIVIYAVDVKFVLLLWCDALYTKGFPTLEQRNEDGESVKNEFTAYTSQESWDAKGWKLRPLQASVATIGIRSNFVIRKH